MSVIAIYKMGLKAGLSEAEATTAAEAVIGTEDLKYLATKEDIAKLDGRVASLEAKFTIGLWVMGVMLTLLVLNIGISVQIFSRLP